MLKTLCIVILAFWSTALISMELEEKSENMLTLHEAAAKGDIDAVQELLNDGADVNTQDQGGETPLHRAIRNGHVAVVEHLVKIADVNKPHHYGMTPLHIAASKGHEPIVKILLAAPTINVNAKAGMTRLRRTTHNMVNAVFEILFQITIAKVVGVRDEKLASTLIVVKEAIQAFYTDSKDSDGLTPLHIAVASSNYNIAKMILTTPNINLSLTSAQGKNPLDLALNKTDAPDDSQKNLIQSLLLFGARITPPTIFAKQFTYNGFNQREKNILDKVFDNPLIVAAIINDQKTLIASLRHQKNNSDISRALCYAVAQRNHDAIKSLLLFANGPMLQEVLRHIDLLLTQILTNEQKATYERIKYRLETKLVQCPICLEAFINTPERKPQALTCAHTFHQDCIQREMVACKERKKPSTTYSGIMCPVCNQPCEAIDTQLIDYKLFIAVGAKDLSAIKKLLLEEEADVNYEYNGTTTFFYAVSMGNIDVVNLLLNCIGETPISNFQDCLFKSTENGNGPVILALLKAGAFVDRHNQSLIAILEKTLFKQAVLLFSILGQHLSLKPLVSGSSAEIILEALYYAIAQAHPNIVILLLSEYMEKTKGSRHDELKKLIEHAQQLFKRSDAEHKDRYQKIILLLSAPTICQLQQDRSFLSKLNVDMIALLILFSATKPLP